MIKKILACIISFQLALAPAIASAEETEDIPASTLPELSYTLGKSGQTVTFKTDMYLLLPETWAFINHERTAMRDRYQLEFDTALALERQRFQMTTDLNKSQIAYLNRELTRTNELLITTQKQKSMSDWTPVIVVGSVVLGMLITTATVYAVTNGEGVR